MTETRQERKYNDKWRVLFQDSIISVLSSLLAFLLVRWLTEPVPRFSLLLAKWLGFALVASLVGFLIADSYRAVRRYATLRSMGKVVLAVFIKEALLALVLIFGLVPSGSVIMATRISSPYRLIAMFKALAMVGSPSRGSAVPESRKACAYAFASRQV